MAIRIGSNISALNAQRFLAAATEGVARVSEQLSSGLRINRASDDAAGLAIASALRADSRIASQALRNVNDGLSVISISKGALNQLSDITIRHKELAEQAANGVYSSPQRAAMNKEAVALTDEYNRIVATTEFNGQKLFTHNWEKLTVQGGAGAENAIGFSLGDEIAAKVTAGSYFTLNFDGRKTVVWFNVDGKGSAPSVTADSFVRVDVKTYDVSRIVDLDIAALDYSSWTWESNWKDAAFHLGRKDSLDYYLWFDPGGGSAPSWFDGGEVGTAVDVSSVATREDLAQAITTAINSAGGPFTAADLGSGKVQLGTAEPGDAGFAFEDGAWWINWNTLQTGISHDTAASLLQKVSAALAPYGYTRVVEGGNTLKVTGSSTGDYADAATGTSNIYVSAVQDGAGLATYALNSMYSSDVTLADFNRDGCIDLAAATYLDETVSVRFGNGDGTFGTATEYLSAPGRTKPIASGDLDNDGDIDLVTGNYLATGKSLTVMLNNGDGTFSVQQSVAIGCQPMRIVLADLDNDGTLEVAVTGYSTGAGGLSILENNGAGGLSVRNEYGSTVSGGFEGLVAGDMDGDGLLDLASGSSYWTGLRIWKGDGNGSFTAIHTYNIDLHGNDIAGADLDGDGDFDLLSRDTPGNALLLFNDGLGDFTSTRTLTDHDCYAGAEIADMNGDGLPDIVTSAWGVGVDVALNSGGGNFSAAAGYTMGADIRGLAIADISGDGAADIVAVDTNWGSPSYLRLRLNNGDGTFFPPGGDQKESVWLSFGDPRGRADIPHIDLSTKGGALAALNVLAGRLDKITREVGSLGASASRLETTVNRLSVDRENFEAASSRITDVDVAQATSQLVQRRILQQLGASILAQANRSPLLAVQLLRNG